MWNTGGYSSLGASTTFLGALLSGSYVSLGAESKTSCGTILATSYVSIPAGINIKSSNCAATETWAGSVNGLSANLNIVDGVVSSIPEPESYLIFLAGLSLIALRLNKQKNN